MITDWLNEHGRNPEIEKQVEREVEEMYVEYSAKKPFEDFQKENPIVPQNHMLPFKLGYIKGVKLQQERSYSEEDMIDFAFNTYHYISELMGVPFRQVSENKLHVMYNLEQYKKK
jgi:hypothetical protein